MNRVLQNIAKAPVKFYRRAISPLIPASCRFEPSCSAYMLEALDKHGAPRGLYLGLRRLMKCHPFNRACRYDPVPDAD